MPAARLNDQLDVTLAGMSPRLDPITYVFAAIDSPPPGIDDYFARIREPDGVTLVAGEDQLRAAGVEVPQSSPRWRRIDPGIDTDLDAVGVMARISGELAARGISVNPIAALKRDHFFVPIARADEALEVLRGIARSALSMTDVQSVLEFWFGPLTGGFAADAKRKQWFESSSALDDMIRARFAPQLNAAAAGQLQEWRETARGTLAYIVVTDQFSRQIHRGTRAAFATDALALAAARAGVASGLDRKLAHDERVFFYMPFEHSESSTDQDECLRLFTELRDETPAAHRHITDSFLRHVNAHRDIIARFGRFPHRNDVLGRASTEAELKFLEGASRFGQ